MRLLLFAFVIAITKAHRSLPSGVTCGSQFSSPETPLTIPNPTISWANYGIYTCEHPINWLEAVADANQELKFTITVPAIDRFANVRMSAIFIGPGLPTLIPAKNVPSSVLQYAADNTMGGVVFKSPLDQSTCDHLTSPEMLDASEVKDGRCNFYEPFGGSNMWVIMDYILAVPKSATYKVAVYEEDGFTAKAGFACCDWPEDFVTPYSTPESTCPACGTNSSNPAWSSLYYEHKSMAEYSGFPPIQNCNTNTDIIEYPSDDMCPPLNNNDDRQPETCDLGCNSQGECHSHNVFGGCTYLLDWNIEPKFSEAYVSRVIIFMGDKIRFTAPTTLPHTLIEMTGETSLRQCDFTGSSTIALVGDIFTGYEVIFDTAGTFYFSCSIGSHCDNGQRLIVEVKDALDGLKCHSHDEQREISNTPVQCQGELVNVRAIDKKLYGSLNANECAEFCTSSVALSYMAGVDEGSCSELDYVYNPTSKIITLPNSSTDIKVIVFSATEESSQCHCHSYEKITCPGEDASIDPLYAEHIQEIAEFCTGVLIGSEEDCPYKCFQPMEVLHLHYIECPSRAKDSGYQLVDATNKCHTVAPVPVGSSIGCELSEPPSITKGAKPLKGKKIKKGKDSKFLKSKKEKKKAKKIKGGKT